MIGPFKSRSCHHELTSKVLSVQVIVQPSSGFGTPDVHRFQVTRKAEKQHDVLTVADSRLTLVTVGPLAPGTQLVTVARHPPRLLQALSESDLTKWETAFATKPSPGMTGTHRIDEALSPAPKLPVSEPVVELVAEPEQEAEHEAESVPETLPVEDAVE